MADELVKEALALGGRIAPFIGTLYFRKWLDDDKKSYTIVALHFTDFTQARENVEQAKKWGWEGFTDIINLKVGNLPLPDKQEDGPGCPYHGEKFLKPSKHKGGGLFCSAKLLDGSYCKHTQPA